MEIFGFTIDFWTIWGLAAQGLFFSSFVVQWLKSEKMQESHLPAEFWYLRLAGSLMLFAYVVQRRDLVFFITIILQVMIYMRNITLMRADKVPATKAEKARTKQVSASQKPQTKPHKK